MAGKYCENDLKRPKPEHGRETKSGGRVGKLQTDFGMDNASTHKVGNGRGKDLKGSVTDLSSSFSGSNVKRIK